MKIVIARAFGGPDVFDVVERPTPAPGPGQVLVRITSIGLNYAELMARRGQYKLISGDPPFTTGLEGGGIIEAVGPGVSDRHTGQRVILSPDAPRRKDAANPDLGGGTYRSHYLCDAAQTIPAPSVLPDDQLGAIWLTYLTAWGCLDTYQHVSPGAIVALPGASSGVALAAAQVVKHLGGITIGLTTSASKVDALKTIPTAKFDHIVVTHDQGKMLPWHTDIRRITDSRGVDVYFDPVASGEYLNTEIRTLAQYGTIWVYGLLGAPGVVDVQPLIRKSAAIRGWSIGEMSAKGAQSYGPATASILACFESGEFKQHIAARYKLDEVRAAHAEMEKGAHIGKIVLTP